LHDPELVDIREPSMATVVGRVRFWLVEQGIWLMESCSYACCSSHGSDVRLSDTYQNARSTLQTCPKVFARGLLENPSVSRPAATKLEKVNDTPYGGHEGLTSFRSSRWGRAPELGCSISLAPVTQEIAHPMVSQWYVQYG